VTVEASKWRWCRACDVLWYGRDATCWVCAAATEPGYLAPTMYARQPVHYYWSEAEGKYTPGDPS
jgi:hypothetical protein